MENTSVNYIRLDSLTLSEEDVNELLMISPSQPGNTTNPFSQEICIEEVPQEIENILPEQVLQIQNATNANSQTTHFEEISEDMKCTLSHMQAHQDNGTKIIPASQSGNTTTINSQIIKIEEMPKEITTIQAERVWTLGIEILEQPITNVHRFRYPSESIPTRQPGKAIGCLNGVKSSHDEKSYPKVRVTSYNESPVVILACCVSEKEPYRVHPYGLVGENCDNGICRIEVTPKNNMTAIFEKIGIECITRREIPKSLARYKELRIDPFNQGFEHMNAKTCSTIMDLNSLRLCFQVLIPPSPDASLDEYLPGPCTVSDVIKDSRVHESLKIVDISDNVAPTTGGKKIIMLTGRVNHNDIEVHFNFEHNEKSYDLPGTNIDVHKQAAIRFNTPIFPDQQVTKDVEAKVCLKRTSDGAISKSICFSFKPNRQKRPRESRRGPNENSSGVIVIPPKVGPRRQPPGDVGGNMFTNLINSGETINDVLTPQDIDNLVNASSPLRY